jgi:hypothetical protein
MHDHAEERAEVLEDRRHWTARVAAGAVQLGLLAGLCAVFLALAPNV